MADRNFEHLSCFAGGMYALGAMMKPRGNWIQNLNIGRGITESCFLSYMATETGLGSEAVNPESFGPSGAKYYILRPETVEVSCSFWGGTHRLNSLPMFSIPSLEHILYVEINPRSRLQRLELADCASKREEC